MFRKLVKTGAVAVDEHVFNVTYYETTTVHGSRRFSSEVTLSHDDRIIFDGDSLTGLESKVARLVPATFYSRLLAGRSVVAAA